jgi:hypothetical protein
MQENHFPDKYSLFLQTSEDVTVLIFGSNWSRIERRYNFFFISCP